MKRLLPTLLVITSLCACEPPRTMSPDLAFWFSCAPPGAADLDAKIEAFLSAHGYRVVNLVRIGVASDQHPLRITAMDERHRIVEFTGFRSLPGRYAVGLYSLPPTQHDASFETQLLSLAPEQLGCPTEEVARHDNSSSVRDIHEASVRRIEKLFGDADIASTTTPDKSLERTRDR